MSLLSSCLLLSGQTDNSVYQYQKCGIDVYDFSGMVSGNTVTGLGPFRSIAQNGIQLGYPLVGYYFPASNIASVSGQKGTVMPSVDWAEIRWVVADKVTEPNSEGDNRIHTCDEHSIQQSS